VNLKIIGFVGMPGSGKSVASDVARSLGFGVVVMGDIVRHEAERLRLPPTDENLGHLGNILRANEGAQAIAKRTLEEAKISGKDLVVIDGIRSRDEVNFFRANSDHFQLIEVRAPPEARLKRLANRGRSDDANLANNSVSGSLIVRSCKNSLDEVAEAMERRKCRELSWGMCEAFKEADFFMDNNGSLDEFKSSVKSSLKGMENPIVSGRE
jgi:dephospho-CoA kinase